MLTFVVNAGSSSLKGALFDGKKLLWSETLEKWDVDSAVAFLEKSLSSFDKKKISRVGHRFVHGGELFTEPTLLNDQVLDQLERLNPLAPLHNPRNLLGVRVAQRLLPEAKQIAVFDTAFHATIPEENYLYAIPEKYRTLGVRRFGFHGLSHASCVAHLQHLLGALPKKIVSCHLGSGCSITAVLEGRSLDTTMGFTPMEGMIMGTRSGSIDPGIAFYLYREQHVTPEKLDLELNQKSGLFGLCGTQDMREITAHLNKRPFSIAFELFCRSAAKEISRMIVSLGGVDALLFTGGIGENSPEVRARIVDLLSFLNLRLDATLNQSGKEGTLSKDGRLFLIKSREAEWIASLVQSKF